jgi:aspartate/glutamate racemase
MDGSSPTRIFHARRGQVAYGYPVGMLCAQWHVPMVPGDLNHAATFDFPMRYLEVPGVSGADVLRGNGTQFTAKLIDAAKTLEAEGVRAITGNCGFMAACQRDVAAAVDVPVFLSSLIQLPLLAELIGRDKKVGVLAANSEAVTPELLHAVGFAAPDRLAISGLQAYEHFNEVILQETGTLDVDRLTDEVVEGALQLKTDEPSVGAYLLECSDLPVYSKAIRDATGLPVFDWASFINYVHSAVVPRTYAGIY